MQLMFNYSSAQELGNFGWEWNHIQPINEHTPPYKLEEKHDILSKFIAAGTTIHNQITFLHVGASLGFEHADVTLECYSCYDGKPAIIHVGLFPSRKDYCPWFTTADRCGEDKDLSWIDQHKYQLSLDNPKLYNFNTAAKLTLTISEEEASYIFHHLDEVSSQCIPKYHYNKISNNCIDFAQSIYEMIGGDGHYMEQLYEEPTIMQSIMANQYLRSWLSFLEPLHYYIE